MKSIRTLLHGTIDYAGLFPPAGLDMALAVENYAAYLASPTAWALGRFIVPVERLGEFEDTATQFLPRDASASPWRLSVLPGADLGAGLEQVLAFNRCHAPGAADGAAIIDTIELKATAGQHLRQTLGTIPKTLTTYVELPLKEWDAALLAVLADAEARAKVRSGGITPEMIPHTADLLRFLTLCVKAGLPFKATAGLHHSIRSVQRLTYEPTSPTAMMHGFMNVFLAVALLQQGLSQAAGELLDETSSAAFRFSPEGIAWREHWFDVDALAKLRRVAVAFGSCSFIEPIEDLEALNLL